MKAGLRDYVRDRGIDLRFDGLILGVQVNEWNFHLIS